MIKGKKTWWHLFISLPWIEYTCPFEEECRHFRSVESLSAWSSLSYYGMFLSQSAWSLPYPPPRIMEDFGTDFDNRYYQYTNWGISFGNLVLHSPRDVENPCQGSEKWHLTLVARHLTSTLCCSLFFIMSLSTNNCLSVLYCHHFHQCSESLIADRPSYYPLTCCCLFLIFCHDPPDVSFSSTWHLEHDDSS